MRIFGSPPRYVQGPGTLATLPAEAALLGRRPFVLADPLVQGLLEGLLPAAGVAAFGGEIHAAEIDRVAALAAAHRADVVIAFGGGKTIDCAKGAALAHGLPLIVVPTIASNDAPTSRLIVVYDELHRIVEIRKLPRNPDLVLVDTALIARAPQRFLAAGMGDALSKVFEVEACFAAGGLNFYGGTTPLAARALARSCHEVIRASGVAAMAAAGRGTPDAAFEDVVEAAILMSGIGFESGGLSIAHALTRGLAAHPQTAHALHGEMVAFGTVVQMVHERRPAEEIRDLKAFLRSVGLPDRLEALGLEVVDEATLHPMLAPTLAAPYIGNSRYPLDEAGLAACLVEAGRI